MAHPSQLQLMMYAESALHPQEDVAQAAALSSHLTSCHECRSLVATLEAEARSFSKVLALSAKAQFFAGTEPIAFSPCVSASRFNPRYPYGQPNHRAGAVVMESFV